MGTSGRTTLRWLLSGHPPDPPLNRQLSGDEGNKGLHACLTTRYNEIGWCNEGIGITNELRGTWVTRKC